MDLIKTTLIAAGGTATVWVTTIDVILRWSVGVATIVYLVVAIRNLRK